MKMKKMPLFAALFLLIGLLAAPLTAFAAGDSAGILDRVTRDASAGVRVFDYADILPGDEEQAVANRIAGSIQHTGMDAAVLTVNGTGTGDIREFADYIYSNSGLGKGEDRSGTLFVIDMEQRDFYLYTYGTAIKYYTDRALEYIEDEKMLPYLKSGSYAAAFTAYADGLDLIFDEGLEGTKKKKSLSILEILGSIAAACGIASAPVNSVKRKYSMQAEKRLAEGFNLAYRAGAVLALAKPAADRIMVDRFEQVMPIPQPKPQSSGHGGGHSTTHSSMGGGVHGGRGGKF